MGLFLTSIEWPVKFLVMGTDYQMTATEIEACHPQQLQGKCKWALIGIVFQANDKIKL